MNLKLLASAVAVLLATLLLAGCSASPDRHPTNTEAKAKADAKAKRSRSIADQTLADCIIDRQLRFRSYQYDQHPQSNIDVSRSSIAYAHLNCRRPAAKPASFINSTRSQDHLPAQRRSGGQTVQPQTERIHHAGDMPLMTPPSRQNREPP